jgi:hypothetical protein
MAATMAGRAPDPHASGAAVGRRANRTATERRGDPDADRDFFTTMMVKLNLPELALPPRPAWAAHGACRWHPEIDFFGKPWKLSAAQAVCFSCPVREECLAYAMEWEEPDGVWGGLTPAQRRALRPKRGRGRPRKDARAGGKVRSEAETGRDKSLQAVPTPASRRGALES